MKRKDRSFMLNPFLTIVLAVQNSVIQNLGEKKVYLGNGSLNRFLYVIPKSKLGYRTHNTAPLSEIIKNDYHDKIKSILNYVCTNEKNFTPKVLVLTQSAIACWRNFQSNVEKELRPEGKLSNCQGWAGKISGFVLRIAALLHVASNDLENLVIEEQTMLSALEIGNLLTEHALAAFNLIGIDQTVDDAKHIFNWIKARNANSFTQSEIVLAIRNKKMSKPERLQKALMILHGRNIISAPIKLPTRKPTTLYKVNPFLLTKNLSP